MFKKLFLSISVLSLIVISASFTIPNLKVYAAADTCTWTGLASPNWSNSGNWAGCDNGNLPETGDSLIFPAGAANLASNNNIAGYTFNSISFDDSYVITGSSFSLSGGFLAISNSTSISNAITLTANQTFQGTNLGFITFTGNLDLNGNDLTISVENGSLNFDNIISGAGDIVKIGPAGVRLFGANTFSGNVVVNAGQISIYNSNSLGSAVGDTTINSGGTVNIFTGGLSIADNFNIAGPGNLGAGAIRNFTGNNTITGNINLDNSAGIQSNAGNALTLDGVISGGPSDLDLTGNILLTGTGFNGGDTIITANSDVFIENNHGTSDVNLFGATLREFDSTIGNLNISNSGPLVSSVYPGFINGVNALSALSVNNLNFISPLQNIFYDINDVSSDQILTTGTVTLNNAILNVNGINPSIVVGTVYTFINNDGADAVSGTFSSYAEGSSYVSGGVTYRVSYVGGTGNDVTLTILSAVANLTPVNSVPGNQTTPLNTNLVFNGVNANLVSISDPDAGANPVRLTLTSTNGAMTLSGLVGLSFNTGDGTADTTMVFSGSITDINNALNGLIFTPTNNFSGAGLVQIITNDQGNTGPGGLRTDTDIINITIGTAANPGTTLSDTGGFINYAVLLSLVVFAVIALGLLGLSYHKKIKE